MKVIHKHDEGRTMEEKKYTYSEMKQESTVI